MIAVLTRSYERISAELLRLQGRAGIGAAVRRDQLAATQAALHREVAQMWRSLGMVVLAGREEAAAAAVETMFGVDALRRVMPDADADYLLRSAQRSAKSTVEVVEARLRISRIPLSERVYRSQDLVDGKIDDIVNSALSRGASAAELAKDVRAFVRPDTRGGVRYAAQRLGRTELNNAFHAMQVETAVQTPWTTAVRWNLSGSHPRPDECNDYADGGDLSGGLWTPENVPPKPHPNCLCFTTPETVGRDEFVRQFEAGAYDSFIDRLAGSGGITFR